MNATTGESPAETTEESRPAIVVVETHIEPSVLCRAVRARVREITFA
jgi:hypothetical protein